MECRLARFKEAAGESAPGSVLVAAADAEPNADLLPLLSILGSTPLLLLLPLGFSPRETLERNGGTLAEVPVGLLLCGIRLGVPDKELDLSERVGKGGVVVDCPDRISVFRRLPVLDGKSLDLCCGWVNKFGSADTDTWLRASLTWARVGKGALLELALKEGAVVLAVLAEVFIVVSLEGELLLPVAALRLVPMPLPVPIPGLRTG